LAGVKKIPPFKINRKMRVAPDSFKSDARPLFPKPDCHKRGTGGNPRGATKRWLISP